MEDELWQLVLGDIGLEKLFSISPKFSQELASVIFIFLRESGYFDALRSASL